MSKRTGDRPSGRTIPTGRLLVLRPGQTDWSVAGRHAGRTDVELTEHGQELAWRTAPLLADDHFAQVWTSPLRRARRTAGLVGLAPTGEDSNLVEWDYGG